MQQIVLVLSILSAVFCSPYDDGKYRPRSYYEYDDGKYYRPLDEGKYIPGDEGKYTYIYKQGTWPFDGSYMRQYGFNGEYDPYMGYRIYASRYPHLYGVINGYPPLFSLGKDENLGSFYSFDRSKLLNTVSNAGKKLKLKYEVIVTVVDDESENNAKTSRKNEIQAPLIISKPFK
ncbi:unnamed protein product [Parnassius apollo]|uniref:(apollo) hypothetical protein n=1 Tax=Parnassius apollo TaxID=110799 RepID=A0A8S3XVZ6_PARAO|nr:unnamed protein product [Parnassius apollo]